MADEDLLRCVAAARTLARQQRPDRRPSPAAAALDPAPRGTVVTILRDAQRIAESAWHPCTFDIYDCLHQAWETADHVVAIADLWLAVRRVIPQGARLIDVNDAARPEEIRALFDTAIAAADCVPASRAWRKHAPSRTSSRGSSTVVAKAV